MFGVGEVEVGGWSTIRRLVSHGTPGHRHAISEIVIQPPTPRDWGEQMSALGAY